MRWHEIIASNQQLTIEDIHEYIGDRVFLWDKLVSHLEQTYPPKQHMDYSKDMLQPGWNVKYRRSSKALCTLYPMDGYFICLVVIGPKQENEVSQLISDGIFSTHVVNLYHRTKYSPLGRWLMIEVKDEAILKDIEKLIQLRVKSTRKLNDEKSK